MKLRVGEKNAEVMCHYTAFAEVARQALGSSDDKPSSSRDPDRTDLGKAPTQEAALAQINRALSLG